MCLQRTDLVLWGNISSQCVNQRLAHTPSKRMCNWMSLRFHYLKSKLSVPVWKITQDSEISNYICQSLYKKNFFFQSPKVADVISSYHSTSPHTRCVEPCGKKLLFRVWIWTCSLFHRDKLKKFFFIREKLILSSISS